MFNGVNFLRQVFMVLFCFLRIGPHFRIHRIRPSQTLITFEILLVIMVIWRLVSCLSCSFVLVSALPPHLMWSMAKSFHSSKSFAILQFKSESLIKFNNSSIRLRSFLCGIVFAVRYFVISVVKKTYYDIEVWLTLPGAVVFYGIITFVGYLQNEMNSNELNGNHFELCLFRLIVMYFILPETEHRSLEDIERHYFDDSKPITDIHIPITNNINRIAQ